MDYNYSRVLSDIAKQDIDSTVEYIAKQLNNPTAARELMTKLNNIVDSICAFPRSSHDCKCYLIDDENVRCSLVNNYALIYEILDDKREIHILRFVYARMDLFNLTIK